MSQILPYSSRNCKIKDRLQSQAISTDRLLSSQIHHQRPNYHRKLRKNLLKRPTARRGRGNSTSMMTILTPFSR
jgi:hypothetical protein